MCFPIIALWCHPRSMSTAVERLMRERGDLQCFHEPFIYYYYVECDKRELSFFDIDKTRPSSFVDIVAELREAAESGPVFFKDMSYYVLPELFNHPELASGFKHVFLIRNPRKSILSYHKLDPEFLDEEVGLEAQWRHLSWVKQETGKTPFVIEAETIQQCPKQAIGKMWKNLDLPFVEQAFAWRSENTPEDWRQVAGWHGRAMQENTIKPVTMEGDKTIKAEFEHAARETPKLRHNLDYHWPYYLKLKEIAGQFSKPP